MSRKKRKKTTLRGGSTPADTPNDYISAQKSDVTTEQEMWSEKIEMLMRNMAGIAQSHHLAHLDMYSLYLMKNKILVNMVTVIGIIVSTSIFTSASYCQQTLWVQIITGIVNIIATYLARYQSTSDYATNAQLHRYTSAKWNALYINIDTQLSYDPEYRQNARDYLGWINNIYAELCENSPDIDKNIKKKYKISGNDLKQVP